MAKMRPAGPKSSGHLDAFARQAVEVVAEPEDGPGLTPFGLGQRTVRVIHEAADPSLERIEGAADFSDQKGQDRFEVGGFPRVGRGQVVGQRSAQETTI